MDFHPMRIHYFDPRYISIQPIIIQSTIHRTSRLHVATPFLDRILSFTIKSLRERPWVSGALGGTHLCPFFSCLRFRPSFPLCARSPLRTSRAPSVTSASAILLFLRSTTLQQYIPLLLFLEHILRVLPL